ncbi:glutamate dehydrogenase [Candidatus Xenohaliotis californiensis]|uniref:Glutamate dehydrogenase n=1 Tax=Candidatus Xenohaliotis californiensis TaxID=84677 RepID=A0ABP0EY17_9RICK|nr:glutamate dehydrogenase [Candidatus Xenohaliotis californiensis]
MQSRISHIIKCLDKFETKCNKSLLKDFIHDFYGNASVSILQSNAMTLLKDAEDMYIFAFNKKKQNNLRLRNLDGDYSLSVIEVVADSTPFIADSITAELINNSLSIAKFISCFIGISRNDKGEIVAFNGDKGEIFIRIELFDALCVSDNDIICERLHNIFDSISYIITDKQKMFDALLESTKIIAGYKNYFGNNQIVETTNFLHWLSQDNFIPMACIEYSFSNASDCKDVKVHRISSDVLGVARMENDEVRCLNRLPHQIQNLLVEQLVLEISKSERVAVVGRREHMTCVGIKILDDTGMVVGEKRLLGVFSPNAYCQDIAGVPIAKKKIKSIVTKLKNITILLGYSLKEVEAIARSFSLADLLQHSTMYLADVCLGILNNRRYPKIRVLYSVDKLQRFVSCVVLVPRKNWHSKTVLLSTRILEREFNAKTLNHRVVSAFDSTYLQLEMKTVPGEVYKVNHNTLEEVMKVEISSWSSNLNVLIHNNFHGTSSILDKGYHNIFPSGYQDRFHPSHALKDVCIIDQMLSKGMQSSVGIYNNEGIKQGFELKIYSLERLDISSTFSIIENMGTNILSHNSYYINFVTMPQMWIHCFSLDLSSTMADYNFIKNRYKDALLNILADKIPNDQFNKLIALAGFDWREAMLFRAIASYLKQLHFLYSLDYILQVFIKNLHVTKHILDLFKVRFDITLTSRDSMFRKVEKLLQEDMKYTESIPEYTVIKVFREVILAMLRVNYYQDDGKKDYISFKVKPNNISITPKPKPFAEIFVFAVDMEGVHLRGGSIARGGLRWSDRIEDYRTEILGLMRAQITKNTVIIPTGAKGGFVLKNGYSFEKGISAYKKFLSSLLDITDNIVDGKVIPPNNVIRYDDDDPYLVVAADKGTATFSDYANGISDKYGFWMGDAFASGGSAGYDHKKLGITARGAWISVQHNLMQKGVDIEKNVFSVVGIGDMSGDVFGNGMLLSNKIKLIAAFDHRHIFIDPNPDPGKSFVERKRLFEKVGSSWADYDCSIISKGGGVFSRHVKAIELSSVARSVLGIKRKSCSPNELVRFILKASVDLLWNGGIGTYVKSINETNENVSDKANDNCRVNGKDVRAKVIGEGGNLGLTQLGRIEYAQSKGILNTDYIDNSAGVSCSDHEVNIKIALGEAVKKSKISIEQRNKILESMSKDVSSLVLKDNLEQNVAISFEELQSSVRFESDMFLIKMLEDDGYLDVAFESLPSKKDAEIMANEGNGLTRPQICVLLSHTKMAVYDKLMATNLMSDPYLNKYLIGYFPKKISSQFKDEIMSHALRSEIIATYVTNNMVNRAGLSFLFNVAESTNAEYKQIAAAYIVIKDIYDIDAICKRLSVGANMTSNKVKISLIREMQFFIEYSTAWLVRRYRSASISEIMSEFECLITKVLPELPNMMGSVLLHRIEARKNSLINGKVNRDLASDMAILWQRGYALDIIKIHLLTNVSVNKVGVLYFLLDDKLSLEWMRGMFSKMILKSHWKKIIVKTVFYSMRDKKIDLACRLLKMDNNVNISAEDIVLQWLRCDNMQVDRYLNFIENLKNSGDVTVDMLDVAAKRFEVL